MSRRPGIAKNWFEKFHKTDVAHDDELILNGKHFRSPRYYDQQFEIVNPNQYLKIKARRRAKAKAKPEEKTVFRLRQKERIQKIKLERLKRTLK